MSIKNLVFDADKLIRDHFTRVEAGLPDSYEANWTRKIFQRVITEELESISLLAFGKMNDSLSGGDRESTAVFTDDLFISISTFPYSIEEARVKYYYGGYLPYLDRMMAYGQKENPGCHWLHLQYFWDGTIFWTQLTLFPNKDYLDFSPMYILPTDLLNNKEKEDSGLVQQAFPPDRVFSAAIFKFPGLVK